MTITREQIKAARAMLDWSQKMLAEQCRDISEPTIKLLETGRVRSTENTLSALRKTLETAGIEFLAQNGVRFRDDLLTVIEPKEEGDNPYLRLMEDVYHTTRGKFGEVLFSFVDQSISRPEVIEVQKMIRSAGTAMRFLVRNGDTFLRYPADEYRCLPKGYFLNSSVVCYGDKVAFDITAFNKVIIIHNSDIAEIKRMEFQLLWDMGTMPAAVKSATG